MITLDDCRKLCDADPAMVARIAREESLPEVLALARAHQLCQGANQQFDVRHPIRHAPADRLAA